MKLDARICSMRIDSIEIYERRKSVAEAEEKRPERGGTLPSVETSISATLETAAAFFSTTSSFSSDSSTGV